MIQILEGGYIHYLPIPYIQKIPKKEIMNKSHLCIVHVSKGIGYFACYIFQTHNQGSLPPETTEDFTPPPICQNAREKGKAIFKNVSTPPGGYTWRQMFPFVLPVATQLTFLLVISVDVTLSAVQLVSHYLFAIVLSFLQRCLDIKQLILVR